MTDEHVHGWQANGTVELEKVSHSPVSVWDDVLYRATFAVQSCSCGEVRKIHVGNSDVRTRHEDHWRRKRATA